uniref:Uncharacterized protein n=1 Tax=Oryzias melastigma TaxID=30732 RepID=A0A3B3DV04_ORYME
MLSMGETHLRELDLSYNSITNDGVKELVEGLSHPSSRLKCLRLQGCGLSAPACKYLSAAMKRAPKLVELDLSCNDIGDEGLQNLSCGLKDPSCRLEGLRMNHCGLTRPSCAGIGEALGLESSVLWELNLGNNALSDEGFQLLCEGIRKWATLTHLNLSHCCLSDECCDELASGLASSDSRISELDLSGNELQDRGVKKLCVGLKSRSCTLISLALRCCELTSKSVPVLAAALKSNPQYLTELHLIGNSIEDSDIGVFLELIKNQKYALEMIE